MKKLILIALLLSLPIVARANAASVAEDNHSRDIDIAGAYQRSQDQQDQIDKERTDHQEDLAVQQQKIQELQHEVKQLKCDREKADGKFDVDCATY